MLTIRALLIRVVGLSLLLLASSGDLPAQVNKADLNTALASLGNHDVAIWWNAVTRLTEMGPDAVSSLTGELRNQSDLVRARAALTLGRIGKPAISSIPGLIALLHDRNEQVRENAAEALGCLGPDAASGIEPLLGCLSDASAFVNGKAAESLSRLGPSSVPGLMRVLTGGSPSARWSALIGLEKLGQESISAVPALIRALDDSVDEVRWGAAMSLGHLGGGARLAVPSLLSLLSDRDQDVRQEASLALDRIKPAAVDSAARMPALTATIENLTPRLMKELHVPGVAISLIKNGDLVWTGRYGTVDVRTGARVTDTTMFEACSMTKPVFAYLVMKLVEDGKLNLDRPLVDYLAPSSLRWQEGHERITARMILSHTGGLPNWRKGEEERDGPLPIIFTPGSKHGYSGEGIYYLQRVVEHITGEPLDLYARRKLCVPFGLNHMSFVWTEDVDSCIAGGHDGAGRFREKSKYLHPNAAYSLYTSPDDYAKFVTEIMRPDRSHPGALSRASIDTMLSRQVLALSREPIERPGKARATAVYWGLGWGISATDQGDIIQHSGANRTGFRCFVQFNPSTGSGIVVMTNGMGGSELWTRLIARIGNL